LAALLHGTLVVGVS